jgi:hypothetical protein
VVVVVAPVVVVVAPVVVVVPPVVVVVAPVVVVVAPVVVVVPPPVVVVPPMVVVVAPGPHEMDSTTGKPIEKTVLCSVQWASASTVCVPSFTLMVRVLLPDDPLKVYLCVATVTLSMSTLSWMTFL